MCWVEIRRVSCSPYLPWCHDRRLCPAHPTKHKRRWIGEKNRFHISITSAVVWHAHLFSFWTNWTRRTLETHRKVDIFHRCIYSWDAINQSQSDGALTGGPFGPLKPGNPGLPASPLSPLRPCETAEAQPLITRMAPCAGVPEKPPSLLGIHQD